MLSGGSRPDPVVVICGGSQIQARSGSEEERQIGSTSMRELPIACGVVTLKTSLRGPGIGTLMPLVRRTRRSNGPVERAGCEARYQVFAPPQS